MYECHRFGHYKSEYRTRQNNDNQKQANLVKIEKEPKEISLLWTYVIQKGKQRRILGTLTHDVAVICG